MSGRSIGHAASASDLRTSWCGRHISPAGIASVADNKPGIAAPSDERAAPSVMPGRFNMPEDNAEEPVFPPEGEKHLVSCGTGHDLQPDFRTWPLSGTMCPE
jgi:hypothetical protein